MQTSKRHVFKNTDLPGDLTAFLVLSGNAITERDAAAAFRRWTDGRALAPSSLRREVVIYYDEWPEV